MTENQPSVDYNTENLPTELPILPLFDAALFPKMVLPLVVMEEDSLKLVDEAMAKDRVIGLVVSKKQENVRSSAEGDLAEVGCSALILKMAKSDDDKARPLLLTQPRHYQREKWGEAALRRGYIVCLYPGLDTHHRERDYPGFQNVWKTFKSEYPKASWSSG